MVTLVPFQNTGRKAGRLNLQTDLLEYCGGCLLSLSMTSTITGMVGTPTFYLYCDILLYHTIPYLVRFRH